MGGKWLQLLTEIAPGVKRGRGDFQSRDATASYFLPSFEAAPRSLNVEPITLLVHSYQTLVLRFGGQGSLQPHTRTFTPNERRLRWLQSPGDRGGGARHSDQSSEPHEEGKPLEHSPVDAGPTTEAVFAAPGQGGNPCDAGTGLARFPALRNAWRAAQP
jgi:hypothetical protein